MEYGSIINEIQANHVAESYGPEMGKHWKIGLGCTELLWSDRNPFRVVEINVLGGKIKSLKVQAMKHEVDPNKPHPMGHQDWIIKEDPNGEIVTLKWRKSRNGWYSKGYDGKGWGNRFAMGHAEYYYDWSF